MKHDSFAVFILSHGRADRVRTAKTLRSWGYTGRIIIVCDNEDDQIDEYRKYFPEVVVFDKAKYFKTSDVADNDGTRSIVLPARNACHDIAKDLGLTYFLELDDDYSGFYYRFIENGHLMHEKLPLDDVFDAYLDFLDESGAVTVAFIQGGDLIGGAQSGTFRKGLLRKVMNCFFCRTDRPFKFYGRINEDTTAYCYLGSQGKLMLSPTFLEVNQMMTQQNAGGLTDAYLQLGTYRKSFYSVMFMPSAVKIGTMGEQHHRYHHSIDWERCVPKIIEEKWRKAA